VECAAVHFDASANARKELQTALQEATSEDRALEIMNRLSTGASYTSIIDFYFRSGMTYDEFAPLADQLTTSSAETLTGLVNVNTAPKEVLLCLAGLEESDVEALLSYRSANDTLESVAWVTQALTQEKATGIGAYITTRSCQYSADIVGVSGNGRV
jgi:DNA uptake protein ComE-like DNA-binding protein